MCLFRGVDNWLSNLAKDVAPASRTAHICVAEPNNKLERATVIGALRPQLCSYNGGLAPHADRLIRIFLMLILDATRAGHSKKVRFRVGLPGAPHENEVVGQNTAHGIGIVVLHR